MVSSNALEAIGVTFGIGRICRLQDVNFEALERKFTALLASNGSGKTTLIKVRGKRYCSLKRGLCCWPEEMFAATPRELYQHVGLVFQNPTDQLFGATAGEDVAFGPRNLDWKSLRFNGVCRNLWRPWLWRICATGLFTI
jgi:energy-coupling factor transporter ATP-binding protein EcfA2